MRRLPVPPSFSHVHLTPGAARLLIQAEFLRAPMLPKHKPTYRRTHRKQTRTHGTPTHPHTASEKQGEAAAFVSFLLAVERGGESALSCLGMSRCGTAASAAGGRLEIRDYHCDALAAPVLSQPRLWPFCLNEDVVSNKSTLSVRRQRVLRETEEQRQAEEE